MKNHKSRTTHRAKKAASLSSHRMPKFVPTDREGRPEKFSKMETGQVDRNEGRGPMGQEGEGERQNDQLAELERMMPESNPPYRRGRRSR